MAFWQAELWNPMLRGKSGSGMGEGSVDDPRESFVMLSFFDRLKPVENESTDNPDRVRSASSRCATPGSIRGFGRGRVGDYCAFVWQRADASAAGS